MTGLADDAIGYAETAATSAATAASNTNPLVAGTVIAAISPTTNSVNGFSIYSPLGNPSVGMSLTINGQQTTVTGMLMWNTQGTVAAITVSPPLSATPVNGTPWSVPQAATQQQGAAAISNSSGLPKCSVGFASGRSDSPATGATADFNAADGDYAQVGTFDPTNDSEQAIAAKIVIGSGGFTCTVQTNDSAGMSAPGVTVYGPFQ